MRLNLTLAQLAQIIGGVLHGSGGKVFNAISKDTRTLLPGDVYWALGGANFDGHNFAGEAFAKGALAAVASRPVAGDYVEVKDTLSALQTFARWHRLQNKGLKVAAITGSNGKSSTKQMLLAILGAAGKTVASAGNLNNQIGVPLSLLEIMPQDKYGVFELGASKRGDIAEIAPLAAPDVAIITNIAPAHMEFFGDLQTVFETKTEIIQGLRPGGVLVYNADDELLSQIKYAPAITFGFGPAAVLRIEEGDDFAFTYQNQRYALPLKLERHNKLNAAAACAAAFALGVGPDGLANYTPMPLRLQEVRRNGVTFILDYYNANPASMLNALQILAKKPGPRIAVLGDMLELGPKSPQYHAELAQKILTLGDTNKIYLAGPQMRAAYDVLKGKIAVEYAQDKTALIPAIKTALKGAKTVLIKASRSMNFEDIYKEIQ